MTSNIEYLSQLTRDDLAEIAAAANLHGGEGVDVTATDAGKEVRLDKDVFRLWLWNFYHNGGFTATNPLNVSVDQVSQS